MYAEHAILAPFQNGWVLLHGVSKTGVIVLKSGEGWRKWAKILSLPLARL